MTDAHGEHNSGDVAPGIVQAADFNIRKGIQTYLIGLGLAALLTIASFYAVEARFIWGPGIPVALIVLAIAQIGVHLVFFLHLTTAPDNTNNILALAFGVLVVGMIIGGSLWIMSHLDHRMMPMYEIIEMQR